MRHFFLLSIITFLLLSCAEKTENKDIPAKSSKPKVTLVKKWETDTVFTTSESAIYDEKRDVIYVSNIELGPWDADGKGSIGQLSLDGKVINARWVEGLNAPKGLGIVNDYLYVTDLKTLVEIDIPTGKINKKYEVEGAGGVNDVTTSPDGIVYFSDSQAGKIFKLENGEVSQIKDNLASSNGIFYEKDRLLIGTWGDEKLIAMSLSDNSLSTVSDSIPQPDGIEADGTGGYLVTSWKGLIHYVHTDGTSEVILDSVDDKIGAADIDYIKEKNLLLVPTFFHNTVVAYELVKN
ncbi:SMP-30/gluconolactonase/LRE family protein [Portibacter lacus]|uniref:ATP-binding protein n=1 Tax=Portibacter lacus TaxID=1099794 RepID=A0AA37STB3_9BACT|nr:hypothetical protein [Portibacter lacus]GLR17630.1 ATP-binding protein [Portibacter lacus]